MNDIETTTGISQMMWAIDKEILPIIIAVFVGALGLTAILTGILIPILKKNKAKQTIHEDVPENHQEKSGTPTMGGIAIVIGVTIPTLVASFVLTGTIITSVMVTVAVFIMFALLGFIDDFNKIRNKRNLGLTAKQKLFLQCFIALDVSIVYVVFQGNPTNIHIPFTSTFIELGYWYILFMTFAIVAMVNSVNLTDGLDGLASGVSLIVCIFFGFMALSNSFVSGDWFFIALAGGCAGFLIFNKNPAKIFMGDTGSMAIGGGMTLAAFYTHMEMLIIIAGFVYVAEALSDIIQVGSYKLRNGKRVFKMAPLHHHFELVGWSERKIVAVFMLATVILCILAYIGAY